MRTDNVRRLKTEQDKHNLQERNNVLTETHKEQDQLRKVELTEAIALAEQDNRNLQEHKEPADQHLQELALLQAEPLKEILQAIEEKEDK